MNINQINDFGISLAIIKKMIIIKQQENHTGLGLSPYS